MTEPVVFYEKTTDDISIEIDGPLSPYTFDYTIDNTTGYTVGSENDRFFIKFDFLSSLFGKNSETITIKINDLTIIKDVDGNDLTTSEMSIEIPFFLVVLSEDDKAAADSQSSASIISLILTFGTSVFIQVVLGGTIEATWLLLGTLQLMSFLPLLSLDIPANFRQFAKNLAVLHGEPEAIPNVFEYYYDGENIDKEPFTQYFELMGFKTTLLLLNSGRKMMIWMSIGLFMGISWILYDIASYSKKFGGIITKIDTKLRYGFIIRAVSQSYISLVLSTCLNVFTITWSGNVSYVSNLIGLGAAVVMMYIPIIAFSTIYSATNLEDAEFKKRYKTFVIDLKTSSPICFHYSTIFFFRRAVYA